MAMTKHYVVTCNGGGDGLGAPAIAVFDIDRATAEQIIRLAAVVKANDACEIALWDDRALWLESDFGSERANFGEGWAETALANPNAFQIDPNDAGLMQSETGRLIVTDYSFRFSCYRKHCVDEIESDEQMIAELADHFGLPLTPQNDGVDEDDEADAELEAADRRLDAGEIAYLNGEISLKDFNNGNF